MAKDWIVLLLWLVSTPLLAQTTHTVNMDGTADFSDIQPALNAAADGDTVLVAPGEYVITEPVDFNRLHDPEDPASPPVKNIVLRSEAGAEATVIRAGEVFSEAGPLQGSTCVLFANGETNESLFAGFTVTSDPPNESVRNRHGIGVHGASPTIDRCKISENRFGGGVYCEGSSAIIVNCQITSNGSSENGGGAALGGGAVTFENCLIAGNEADFSGGAIMACGGSHCFVNCTIVWNYGEYNSISLGCTQGVDASLSFVNCVVWGKKSAEQPLIYIAGDAVLSVEHACLEENAVSAADDRPAAHWMGKGIINQTPRFKAPGFWETCETPSFENCIPFEWGPGGHPGGYLHYVHGDYRLQSDSPCIDVGATDGAPSTDIEGNPRPCGDAVDMGSYEFQTEGCIPRIDFLRGDCNDDGAVDISDASCLLNWLFLGGATPGCIAVTNTNGTDGTDISDAAYLLNHLFLGGAPLVAPYPECGEGTLSEDTETCGTPPQHCFE